ncbi:MAG: hypothetical protein KC550_06840, partial [Nanoarchaeota archaeon]|nr:hypothetical protein [Nanoarchaeota archaeon]
NSITIIILVIFISISTNNIEKETNTINSQTNEIQTINMENHEVQTTKSENNEIQTMETSNYNNQLILKEALLNYDKSKCEEISNINIKKHCINEVQFNVISSEVISKNDVSICEKLISNDLIFRCNENYEKFQEVNN